MAGGGLSAGPHRILWITVIAAAVAAGVGAVLLRTKGISSEPAHSAEREEPLRRAAWRAARTRQ